MNGPTKTPRQRPPQPDLIRGWYLEQIPQCCHTCEHYTAEGDCRVYRMRPPDDFAAQLDACPEWAGDVVPF